jgi:DNA-binding transcriptional ArsR family regulator
VNPGGRLPTGRKVVQFRPKPRQRLSRAEQDQILAAAPRVARNTLRAILTVTAGNDLLKARLYPDPADPAKRTLVERTDIPRRTIERHLALLVDAGLLVCQVTGNRGRIPEYRILRRAERESFTAPATWARIADPELRAEALELWTSEKARQ